MQKYKKKLNFLIACEYSGRVRDAIIATGHNATSCDILPTESPGPHYQGNVLDIINDGWDCMIAFPPCTYLSYAGNKYWNLPGRDVLRAEAVKFFITLATAKINHIAIENPLGCMGRLYRPHDQIIHPYYFGEPKLKRTCLWLKNLPKLVHIKQPDLFNEKTHTDKPAPIYFERTGKKRYFTDAISGTKNKKLRSLIFNSFAQAMANQWVTHMESLATGANIVILNINAEVCNDTFKG